jgi:glycosyltransferase involved in cell wall biosynthesis
MNNTLSVVISAYNEEKNIKECLTSVTWVDEIIVINNGSTDKTEEIARKYTTHIIRQENDPQRIDLQKNTGFEKASGSWIFSLDADERIPKELAEEIKKLLSNKEIIEAGYEIPRKNIIFGKWIQHSLWWPDYQLRLFKKGKGKFTNVSVHKSITITGEIGRLAEPMLHENYTSITQYVRKMDDIYAENEAIALVKSGKKLRSLDSISMPAHDFLKTFFLQKGYKDGLHGLVLSLLQAFYAFLVFAKVWEKQGFTEDNSKNFLHVVWTEMKQLSREFNYWYLTETISESTDTLKKMYLKLKRRKHTKSHETHK